MGKITSRAFRPGDENGIVDLYNLVTGRSRTPEQHRWEWFSGPLGAGTIMVIEEDGREIVGHHGLIPIPLSCRGQSLVFGKTENTILHPRYLGTGMYARFEKRFVSQVSGYDVLFTTAGGGAPGRIRKSLGYREVGHYAYYFRVLDWRKMVNLISSRLSSRPGVLMKPLARFLRTVLSLPSDAFNSLLKSTNNPAIDIDLAPLEDPEEAKQSLDAFWDGMKLDYGITVDRSFQYLKWRFLDNPNVKYDVHIARVAGEIVGYAILKYKESGGETIAYVEDLVVRPDDRLASQSLLHGIANLARDRAAMLVFATLEHSFLHTTLLESGFSTLSGRLRAFLRRSITGVDPTVDTLLAKNVSSAIPDSDLWDPSRWYYTGIFTEGIA